MDVTDTEFKPMNTWKVEFCLFFYFYSLECVMGMCGGGGKIRKPVCAEYVTTEFCT